MKNIVYTIAFIISLSLSLDLPSFAQMGTMKWNFQNRGQVRQAVRSNTKNLRKSYEIIVSARRQGMINSVLQEYEALIGDKTFGVPPELCSSYALAHFVSYRPMQWDIGYDTTRGLHKYGQDYALRVDWYRQNAVKLLPRSPEVLLGQALWLERNSGPNGSKVALPMIERAVRLAPTWADAHYWHCDIVQIYRDNLPQNQKAKGVPRYAMVGLRAMERAERLDPAFKDIGFLRRSNIYTDLKQPQKALFYFDAYVQKHSPALSNTMDKMLGPGYISERREQMAEMARAASKKS